MKTTNKAWQAFWGSHYRKVKIQDGYVYEYLVTVPWIVWDGWKSYFDTRQIWWPVMSVNEFMEVYGD